MSLCSCAIYVWRTTCTEQPVGPFHHLEQNIVDKFMLKKKKKSTCGAGFIFLRHENEIYLVLLDKSAHSLELYWSDYKSSIHWFVWLKG